MSDQDIDEKARRNERIKLLANTINAVGLAFLVTGVMLPVITLLYGGDPPKSPVAPWIGVWLLILAVSLHATARSILGGIKG